MWVLILRLLAFVFWNRPEDIGQVVVGALEQQAETVASNAELYRNHTLGEAVKRRHYWIMADAAVMFGPYALSFSIIMLIGGALADRVPLNLLLVATLVCWVGLCC